MLEQTARVVQEEGAVSVSAKLKAVCSGRPVEKPADHKGASQTDMFALSLTKSERAKVLLAVRAAALRLRMTNPKGFVAAWLEYVSWEGG